MAWPLYVENLHSLLINVLYKNLEIKVKVYEEAKQHS